MISIAHQKLIRESNINNEQFPAPDNIDLSNAVVKQITFNEAKKIIEHYEWLGCMASISQYCYGIFFDGVLGGTVIYGSEYSENLGTWDKYDYTGKIILLNRGACVHWTPIGAASKLIRQSMKLLPSKYKVITCTVDSNAGEIGTIYQACNFHYVGVMRKTKHRDCFIINGRKYSARTIRGRYGHQRLEDLKKIEPTIEKVKEVSKARYFAFRGGTREKKYLLTKIKDLIKEYPKRG